MSGLRGLRCALTYFLPCVRDRRSESNWRTATHLAECKPNVRNGNADTYYRRKLRRFAKSSKTVVLFRERVARSGTTAITRHQLDDSDLSRPDMLGVAPQHGCSRSGPPTTAGLRGSVAGDELTRDVNGLAAALRKVMAPCGPIRSVFDSSKALLNQEMLAGSSFIVLTVDGRHAPIRLRSGVTRFATSLGGDREWRVVERLEELAPRIGRIRRVSRSRPVERQRYGPSFGQQQCTDQVTDVVRQPRFEMIEAHAVDARLARSAYYFDANQG